MWEVGKGERKTRRHRLGRRCARFLDSLISTYSADRSSLEVEDDARDGRGAGGGRDTGGGEEDTGGVDLPFGE